MRLITIDKEEVPLAYLNGKVSLVVNTSSNSSSDLKELESLSRLEVPVLIFPSNSFSNEPSPYKDIKAKYSPLFTSGMNTATNRDTFKIFQKVEVNG